MSNARIASASRGGHSASIRKLHENMLLAEIHIFRMMINYSNMKTEDDTFSNDFVRIVGIDNMIKLETVEEEDQDEENTIFKETENKNPFH